MSLLRKILKISNKQPNFILQGARERRKKQFQGQQKEENNKGQQ